MKPIYQRILGNKNGDCLKCCVASLLEMEYEQVPNFIEFNNGDWLSAMRYFFYYINLYPVMLRVDESLSRGVDYIAIGSSPRSTNVEVSFSHAVVMNGDVVIHDPHPSGDGIIKIRYVVLFQPIDYKPIWRKNESL